MKLKTKLLYFNQHTGRSIQTNCINLKKNGQVAELVDAALHGGTEPNMSAAFKVRTGSSPVLTTNFKTNTIMAQITIQGLREQYEAKLNKGRLSVDVAAYPTHERWHMHLWEDSVIIATSMGDTHAEAFALLQAKITEPNDDQITVAL